MMPSKMFDNARVTPAGGTQRCANTRLPGKTRAPRRAPIALSVLAATWAWLSGPPAAANGYPIWQYEITLPPNVTDAGEFPAPRIYIARNGEWLQLGELILEESNTLEKLVALSPEDGMESADVEPSSEWRTLLVRFLHMTPGFFVFKDWCPSEMNMIFHGPNNEYPETAGDGRPMVVVFGADDNGFDHDFDDAILYLTYDNNQYGWAEVRPIYTTYKGCNPFGG